MTWRGVGGVFVVGLSVLLAACEVGPGVAATCSKIAEKCQLPDGPLGVCLQRECKPGEVTPCFACTPQH